MVSVKKILVLPDAGTGNPFQHQMINLLKKSGLHIVTGPARRFGATFLTVRQQKPDIIYYDWIQSFILGKTLLVTLIKCVSFILEINYVIRIKKIPIIHTLHNIHNHAKRWIFLERIVYTYFLRKCTRIRVYSETTRTKIIKLFKVNSDKIYIIQDVPFHFYYPNSVSDQESRLYLQIPLQNYVYLCFGMIKPYKGVENLIKVFQQIASSTDTLVIAGPSDNPSYVDYIMSLVNNHSQIIIHNKFINNEAVQYYFNSSNVIVLPFKNIEHSSSIDLAMSFKKAIITLRTDFLHNLLGHQEDLLFNDFNELEQKMRIVKEIDTDIIGKENFRIVDESNYKDFVPFFTKSL